MSSLPLHPALVHLPLGLAFVMPFLAVSLAWALWVRRVPRLTWAIVVALQTVLLAGGLVALRTGEAQRTESRRSSAKPPSPTTKPPLDSSFGSQR